MTGNKSFSRRDRVAEQVRRELGRRIRIHTTPQLHFVFDASLERGMGMDQLIREAVSLSDQSQDKTED